jgi:hypothetical protein
MQVAPTFLCSASASRQIAMDLRIPTLISLQFVVSVGAELPTPGMARQLH